MFSFDDERWTSSVSLAGALVWALLAALAGARHAPLGVIELLFLFAPLVVVPLALALLGAISTPGLPAVEVIARALQPFAAVSAVAAFWRGPGELAGLLSLPWAIVCFAIALSGIPGLRPHPSVPALFGSIARMDLALAGAWLLMSRFGVRSQFQEPIVLLTAVHFHYSGFATSVIAGAGLRFAESSGRRNPWWRIVVPLVGILPFVVAAGFVFSPTLRAVSAVGFSFSVLALALLLVRQSVNFHSPIARLFIAVATAFVLVGMALASTYAIGEFLHRDWLTIPRIASTHGWLNALGFVMPAVLGCLIELRWSATSKGEAVLRLKLFAQSSPASMAPAKPNFVARDFYDN
jgi:hypothetical protein